MSKCIQSKIIITPDMDLSNPITSAIVNHALSMTRRKVLGEVISTDIIFGLTNPTPEKQETACIIKIHYNENTNSTSKP